MNVPPETIFSTPRPSNLNTVPVPGSERKSKLQQIEDALPAQAQIAKAVKAGTAPAARGARSSRATTVRIEIWSRDAPGKPGRRLAIVAEYDARSVQLISLQSAPALMITPVPRSRGLIVRRTTIRSVLPKPKTIAGPEK